MKKHLSKLPDYITGLFFAVYPFLCDAGEAAAILSLVCVAAVCIVVVVAGNKTFRVTVADVMAGAAVLWIVAAYFAGSRGMLSPGKMYEFAALCLLWFTIRNLRDPRRVVPFLLSGALLQVVVCCMQLAGVVKSNNSFFPFTGSFTNPGPLAGFLAVTLFAFPYMWRHRGKIGVGIGIAATLAIIIRSGSRASWLAVCAGTLLCVLPWLLRRYRRLASGKRIIVGCACALIVTISCAGLYFLKPASADGRLLIWKASALLFAESPVCGNGPGAFQREYMYHQADYLADKLMTDEALLADSVAYAFSEPVRIVCEYGMVGFVLFGTFVVVLVAGAWKNQSIRFILAGFVAWLVFGLFGYPGGVNPLRLLFILLAALLAAESRTLWSVGIKLPVKVATVLGVVLLSVGATVDYIHPNTNLDAGYLYRQGVSLLYDEKYDDAIPVIEQALRLAPSSMLSIDLAKCYYEAGCTDEAEICLKTAVNMTPGYVTPAYELFNFYRREGHTAEAHRWAEYILSRKFKVTNSVSLFARKEAREYLGGNPPQ